VKEKAGQCVFLDEFKKSFKNQTFQNILPYIIIVWTSITEDIPSSDAFCSGVDGPGRRSDSFPASFSDGACDRIVRDGAGSSSSSRRAGHLIY
jgi:hypothetical protein